MFDILALLTCFKIFIKKTTTIELFVKKHSHAQPHCELYFHDFMFSLCEPSTKIQSLIGIILHPLLHIELLLSQLYFFSLVLLIYFT
jgi:hypothetical protein